MTKKLPFLLLAVTLSISNVIAATNELPCTDTVDWGNIQFPTSDTSISVGDALNVYAYVYEAGVTDSAGPGSNIEVWIGYSTENTDPSTWTDWVVAGYNGDRDGLSPGDMANDEYFADIGTAISSSGTYYYASRFRLNSCTDFVYGGTGGVWSDDSVKLTIDQVDFCNVQTPKTGSISVGGIFDVYAQVYEDGVTNGSGQGAGIECWIGYNQISENYLPENANNWTWIPANYNTLGPTGSNDEYFIDIGSALPAGTYYYASRWRLNGGDFSYGGIQSDGVGNFWDFTNNSGNLLVGNPSTLAAGDIAITGFNSDNPDQFSFVLLTDINAGTQIRFTDNGWLSSGSFYTNEGILVWTATENLTCGTEIVITDNSPFSSNIGSVTDASLFSLSADGDQILAYQGTEASPTFLYAVNFDSTGWSDNTDARDTALPSGLTDGTNAVNLDEIDNAKYDCSVTVNPTLILASVSTDTNWDENNSTRYTLGDCDYSCSVCSTASTWNGTSWNNGVPDSDTDVTLTGDYTTDATNGSFQACSLTLQSGAELTIENGYYIEVFNDVTVTDGNIITQTAGSFVQRGDGTTAGTFTLDPTNGASRVNKLTAVLANWYNYTYWSSPVSGITVDDGITDGDPGRRFTYNAANYLDSDGDGLDDDANDWVLATGTDTMNPGQGFAATHNEAGFFMPTNYQYNFIGPYNTGDITYTIAYNATNDLHWNLIGNPYPSAIDADAFFAENGADGAAVIYDVLYLWSQVSPPDGANLGNEAINFNQNDYITINAIGEAGNGTTSAPARRVPSAQSFFVASTASGVATFKNSMRVSGNNVNDDFYRSAASNSSIERLYLNLNSDAGIYSQICVAYADIATDAYDGNHIDTDRNYAGNAGYMVSMDNIGEGSYVIQGKALSSLNEDEVIKIAYGAFISTNETYTIEAIKKDGSFLESNPVYIKDNLLNITHDLATPYTFNSDGGYFEDRFEIVFRNNALSTDDILLETSDLVITEGETDNVTFELTNASVTIDSILIYDLQGRMIYDLDGDSSKETYTLGNLNSQIFIAKVTLSDGTLLSKKAVKK